MEWISTKDKLPPVDCEVIVSNGVDFVTSGELTECGDWRVLNGLGTCECTAYCPNNSITHWIPLPKPPKE